DRLWFLPGAFFDPAAAARGLARPVAGASEDAGKHIRPPVDEVSLAVVARRDQPDVFRNWGVGRTGPLAIDDLVKVFGSTDVCRVQTLSFLSASTVVVPCRQRAPAALILPRTALGVPPLKSRILPRLADFHQHWQ